MSLFYTSAHLRGNVIYVRGYANGKPFKDSVDYQPYLFEPNSDGNFKTLDGLRVKKHVFDSIKDAKDYLKESAGIVNRSVFGLPLFLYTYLNDEFFGEIDYDPAIIARVSVDIETDSKDGFPNIETADKEVTACTLSHRRGEGVKRVMFGTKVYRPKDSTVTYILCSHEHDMLEKILEYWNDPEWTPDVVTGWNIDGFDIPYLIRRVGRVLGEQAIKLFSPWRIVQERDIVRGKSAARGGKGIDERTDTVYEIFGIACLDYLELYKKFSFKNQESYKLDHIAWVELKERKLDYSQYGSLHEFYEKDPEGFYDYNLDDTIKIDKLDDKLKLIDLVLAMAYNAKVTFDDTMRTTRPWDVLIHNYLLNEKKIVVPSGDPESDFRPFPGGFVKDPAIGMHKWVVSFDLNSLYPHLIMQYNISPETFVGMHDTPGVSIDFSHGGAPEVQIDWNVFTTEMKEHPPITMDGYTVAANGAIFRKNGVGFIPTLMKKLYDDRVVFKKKMIEAQKQFEATKDQKFKKEEARYHALQMAAKLFLNSGYGALANQYFRWFKIELAEAVTASGQLSIRWIDKKINEYLNKLLKTEGVDYVIASDTDSVYIVLDKLVERVGLKDAETKDVVDFLDKATKKLEEYIEKSYQELADLVNGMGQFMKMKRESIADRGIWKAKKMYILNVWDSEGVRYSEPKVKMKGISAVRSNTPMVCKDAIKKALSIIMTKDESALQAYVSEFKDEFFKKSIVEIGKPSGVNNLADYSDARSIYSKGTPMHVRGSLLFNHYIKEKGLENKYLPIYEGSKIKCVFLRTPNPIRENVIAFPDTLPPELGLDDFVDRETQFEKTFLDSITQITDILKWNTTRSASLMDFL